MAEWMSLLLISQASVICHTVIYTNRYTTSIEWLNLRVQVRAMLQIKKKKVNSAKALLFYVTHPRFLYVFLCVYAVFLFSVQNR